MNYYKYIYKINKRKSNENEYSSVILFAILSTYSKMENIFFCWKDGCVMDKLILSAKYSRMGITWITHNICSGRNTNRKMWQQKMFTVHKWLFEGCQRKIDTDHLTFSFRKISCQNFVTLLIYCCQIVVHHQTCFSAYGLVV